MAGLETERNLKLQDIESDQMTTAKKKPADAKKGRAKLPVQTGGVGGVLGVPVLLLIHQVDECSS